MNEFQIARIVDAKNGEVANVEEYVVGDIQRAYLEFLLSDSGGGMGLFDAQRMEKLTQNFCGELKLTGGYIEETAAVALVGKVQSGKTTAFAMTMTALADRDVGNFILLTGTKTSLDNQTINELKTKFESSRKDRTWRWKFVQANNATSEIEIERQIKEIVESESSGENRWLLVVTCLKEATNLKKLNHIFSQLKRQGVEVERKFALYDDEADQGSPDVSRAGRGPTAINREVVKLRNILGNHIYAPVTATPQSLLVQPRSSEGVRPNSAVLLPPGSSYVGGKDLFLIHRDKFVRAISDSDVNSLNERDWVPPEGLQLSLATFLLSARLMKAAGKLPASMLIHASQTVAPHEHTRDWVIQLLRSWKDQSRDSDFELNDFYGVFRKAAQDLMASAAERVLNAGFGSEGEGLKTWVLSSLSIADTPSIQVRKVSGSDRFDISEWEDADYWILIGGEVLGRGFVVKGLVTTYMPRDTNPSSRHNMDTLQQRARFFGYKRTELDILRGYFPATVIEKFEDYVDHEELLWTFLQDIYESGESLQNARTIWLESKNARGTRAAAHKTSGRTGQVKTGWIQQTYLFDDILAENLQIFTRWKQNLSGIESWNPPAITNRNVRLDSWQVGKKIILELLDNWKARSVDKAIQSAIRSRILRANEGEAFRVVDMNSKSGVRVDVEIREGWRKISESFDMSHGTPWEHPDFAQTIPLLSGSRGQEDRKMNDSESAMTFLVYSIRPHLGHRNADETARHQRVGALAIHNMDPRMQGVFGEEY